MNNSQTAFTAVVLAADRGPADSVARAAGVSCKSMTPVGGTPMVFRVLDALAASWQIKTRILCGPPKSIVELEPKLRSRLTSEDLNWFENKSTPSSSAFHVLQSLPEKTPVLLTTADHALLNARTIDYFCAQALTTGCDVVVGVAQHDAVIKAYPKSQRTAIRLRDGAYCGCNLFAFLTPRSRQAANFWRRVETHRKKPWRLISVLGWLTVLRFFMGKLSLDEALDRISHRLGFKAGAVIIPYPEAAIDVDSISDWKLVKKIVSSNET